MKPQLVASSGMPDRQAVHRRRERVTAMLHELPESAQEAIRAQYAGVDAQVRGAQDDNWPTDVHPRIRG